MTRNEVNYRTYETCYLTTFDGNYTLILSKEKGLSELSHTKTTE